MTPSFFEWDLDLSGGTIRISDLSPESAKHIKAQRLSSGDALILLDGRGKAHHCVLTNDKGILLKTTVQQTAPQRAIHLLLSPPKGDALTEAILQATEMGVAQISLFRSDHCQWSEKMKLPFGRLQRIADQACSQSCRAHRLHLNDRLWSASELKALSTKLHVVADEAASVTSRLTAAPNDLCLWIGPEGGWSDRERQFFDSFAQKVSLGSLILRVPTAIVAAVQTLKDLPARS
jgi:16S rRNA (uracil1498-N3)-methyltransferase